MAVAKVWVCASVVLVVFVWICVTGVRLRLFCCTLASVVKCADMWSIWCRFVSFGFPWCLWCKCWRFVGFGCAVCWGEYKFWLFFGVVLWVLVYIWLLAVRRGEGRGAVVLVFFR